jgi:hypothetical protein
MRLSGWLVLLLPFILACTDSPAQSVIDQLSIQSGAGWMVANHPDFPEIKNPSFVSSVNLLWHHKGQKPWHRYYRYPEIGVQLTGGSMGNSDVLGYFGGAMARMQFDGRLRHRLIPFAALSLGSSWFSKPHDEEENPGNVAIGSRFAFLAGAEAGISLKLKDPLHLTAAVSILHASNSHARLPNVGINMPVFLAGIRYNASVKNISRGDTISIASKYQFRPHLRIALGMNETGSSTGPVNGPTHPIYLVAVYGAYYLTPVNKLSLGVEGWYNKGVYDFIISQEFYSEKQRMKSCSGAILVGHEFLMGHWSLVTTGGIYLYNPFYSDRLEQNEITSFKSKLKSIIPARIGMQYYWKNTFNREYRNLFFGVYIKTNFGQADFLETGMGYNF